MTSFDQLKREAANLERQLEEKLSRYQQLSQKISQSVHSSNNHSNDNSLSRAEEGGGSGNTSSMFDEESALQPELQRLIQRLSDLIQNRLAAGAVTAAQQAAVKRYREIVLDLRTDMDKSVAMVRRAKDRYDLLGGGNSAVNNGGNGNDPAMDHLLRERNHINNSVNAASNVIGQADSIRQDLYNQGRNLRNTQSLMGSIASNIPGINSLVHQIGQRRSRDDKIVAGVIATCILFTLWYLFG